MECIALPLDAAVSEERLSSQQALTPPSVQLKAFLLIAMDLGNRVHNGSAALLRHEGVEGIQKWLRVIFNKMGQDWMPSCVFIDASAAEYNAIRWEHVLVVRTSAYLM